MAEELSTKALHKILDTSSDISEYINKYEDEFTNRNFKVFINFLAKEKNCTIADIIKISNMNESYCYQLFKGIRKPSRDKIIQLCFGMKLNIDESNKLLQSGEKSELYCKNKRDAIIIFGLNNNLSILEVEEILIDRELEALLI